MRAIDIFDTVNLLARVDGLVELATKSGQSEALILSGADKMAQSQGTIALVPEFLAGLDLPEATKEPLRWPPATLAEWTALLRAVEHAVTTGPREIESIWMVCRAVFLTSIVPLPSGMRDRMERHFRVMGIESGGALFDLFAAESMDLRADGNHALRDHFRERQSILRDPGANSSLPYSVPSGVLSPDVTTVVNGTFAEALTCLENDCFSATIALCGRVIETVIFSLLLEHGVNMDEARMGFDAGRRELQRRGYRFESTLSDTMVLVNAHRNKVVHGNARLATSGEARAVALLTREVLTCAAAERLRALPRTN